MDRRRDSYLELLDEVTLELNLPKQGLYLLGSVFRRDVEHEAYLSPSLKKKKKKKHLLVNSHI